ncbi:hypothetical protein [Romboutsia ilealis]|uniref:hypothetical protein n=1 Tax=Romboutsia ilealis TaxID=1115758 RepID=UPI00272C1D29|nr:hypothetical protein [Romboutsia ilealis]
MGLFSHDYIYDGLDVLISTKEVELNKLLKEKDDLENKMILAVKSVDDELSFISYKSALDMLYIKIDMVESFIKDLKNIRR